MKQSEQLRANLSMRLRQRTPPRWAEFSRLWMAFNALYGGDPGASERRRVMGIVRRLTRGKDASHLLSSHRGAIARLISSPPADFRLESWDPRFRAASKRCVRRYQNRKLSAPERLGAVAGITYQVRCNLLHGSKDPDVSRDRMLVQASVEILRDLVPLLENAILNR